MPNDLTPSQIELLLEQLRSQNYPLEVRQDQAEALVCCMRTIMRAVPEDDHVMLRWEYNLATSALMHPAPHGSSEFHTED